MFHQCTVLSPYSDVSVYSWHLHFFGKREDDAGVAGLGQGRGPPWSQSSVVSQSQSLVSRLSHAALTIARCSRPHTHWIITNTFIYRVRCHAFSLDFNSRVFFFLMPRVKNYCSYGQGHLGTGSFCVPYRRLDRLTMIDVPCATYWHCLYITF